MSSHRTVARNVLWNWAGTGAQMIAGLLVMPFLVQHLGKAGYGLWILIVSLTGYFDVLDLGIRGSLGRNIAFRRAKDDPDGVQAIISTGLAMLCGCAGLVLLGTIAVLPLFFRLFDVPQDQQASTRVALVLIGVNLAVVFPVSVFDAILWAYQRFDQLNCIEIPANVLRVVLTFVLIGQGHGLVTLALITLGVTLASGTAKAMCCLRLDRSLRFGRSHIRTEAAHSLFGFGVWCFILSVTRLISDKLGPLIIGSRLDIALVTPFAIAGRMLGCVTSVLLASTGVLTPLATALHAEGKRQLQQRLFIEGGKWCFALALFFFGLCAFLGESLIELWIRQDLEYAWQMLLILFLGELLPLSQHVTGGMILGMGKHRLLALMGIVETAAGLGLALVLLRPYGLLGVCLSIAVPAALCRGLVQLTYGCRLLHVRPGHYLRRALGPAVFAAALPAAVLAGLTRWHEPNNWLELIAFGVLYGICYLVTGSFVLLGCERVKLVGGLVLAQVFGERPAVSEFPEG